ncbi:MAG: hypothetical protein ACRED5_01825 [Propylenella sp.]
MITLERDMLNFRFPDVHDSAVCPIHFQRTLRLPDDGRTYPLPAGLGRFPLRHIDDFPGLPETFRRRGGVVMPMWQAEAMWVCFAGWGDYPFAVKIAAGKINAVSGEDWREGLHRHPQDYVVVPRQPWLDGFSVKAGRIRQFVAAPLGKGITAEEQLTGAAEHGGLQIVAYPMKKEAYERLFKRELVVAELYQMPFPCAAPVASMGLAAGGLMEQEIYQDEYDFDVWDLRASSRCFVTLLNAEDWHRITGEAPPTEPISAGVYHKHRIPWFDYYAADATALAGSLRLAGLKTIKDAVKFGLGKDKWKDEPVAVPPVVQLGPDKRPHRASNEVRQADF